MRPVICLITPPRPPEPETTRDLVGRIGAAARAGVHLVQIRQPGMDGRLLSALAAAAVDAVRGTRTRVLVNDRFDVALAVGAHGVHLRGDSPPASRVRPLAPKGFLIGRSVHAPEEAQAVSREGAVDYVIYGTVFATDSKPGAPTTGTERLAAVCMSIPIPVLAVGGITLARVSAVAAAGADGVAAIGLFAAGTARELPEIVGHVARAFDTPRCVP